MTDPQLTLGLGLPEAEVRFSSARRDRLEEAVLALCDGFELRIHDSYTHEIGFNRQRRVVRLAEHVVKEVLETAAYMGKAVLWTDIDWRPNHSIPEDFYA